MMSKHATLSAFETRMDLDESIREPMAALLNQHLADLIDLRSQTKQAHWNVRGTHFIAYHELFDTLAAQLNEPIDNVAERIGALGYRAEGTTRMAASNSRLVDWSLDMTSGEEIVEAIADRFSYVAAFTRSAIDKASESGDEVTTDLLTEAARGLDKSLWFLEAHLQG
jgi:starvation-inducible DNA-binding protein